MIELFQNRRLELPQARKKRIYQNISAYLFVLPTLLILMAVILYPFITAIAISFTDKHLGEKGSFIGLENFRKLFSDKVFLRAFLNTIIYTVSAVVLRFLIGLASALVLNLKFRFNGLVRMLVILPWAVSPFIAALTWKWMFNEYTGFINVLLTKLHLISSPVFWLSDPKLAMPSIILAATWQGYPFYTLMFLAGLVSIPNELYEAAKIDGANVFKRFLYITLPSLMPVIITTLLLSTIWTFNQFQYVYTMTGGGPGSITHVLPTLTIKYGIQMRNISLASAVSLSAFPVFLVLIVYLTKSMLGKEE